MIPDVASEDQAEEFRAYPKSVQPGIPVLGAIPDGWLQLPMGNLLTVVQRPAKMVDDNFYELVTARRNRGGIVARGRMTGKQIATKTQFWVKGGDFVMSRRQIAHGACGILPDVLDGSLVSNEYAALLPTDNLDAGFLRHLPHSIYFQQTCFHSSIGVHVEKLVFNLEHWLTWPFSVPPLLEQRRVATVLDAWDAAISAAERLLEAKLKRLNLIEDCVFGTRSATGASQQEWSDLQMIEAFDLQIGGTPSRSIETYWAGARSDGLPWVSIADMRQHYIYNTAECITELGASKSNVKLIKAGTLLLSFKLTLGRVSIAGVDCYTNEAISALIPKIAIDTDFAIRLLQRVDFAQQAEQAIKGMTLNKQSLGEIVISLPTIEVQRDIAIKIAPFLNDYARANDYVTALRLQKGGLTQLLLAGKLRARESLDALMPSPPMLESAE